MLMTPEALLPRLWAMANVPHIGRSATSGRCAAPREHPRVEQHQHQDIGALDPIEPHRVACYSDQIA
jgi:hypothetical protein